MRPLRRAAGGASLTARWAACAFPRRWRRSQQQALDAAERAFAAGRCCAHLVLPPGAGKTAVGLEIARRRARSTLVLVPNSAVQGQWLAQWDTFAPQGATTHPVPARGEPEPGPLVVLPARALVLGDRADDPDATEPPTYPDSDPLDALHPRVRDLLGRAGRRGPWLVVLDESPDLLAGWGELLQAVVRSLGPGTEVVGLTATPPEDLPSDLRALSDRVLGPPDAVVALPAAVRDGDIAPYQDLLLYVSPTAEERERVAAEADRFERLRATLLERGAGSVPLAGWLQARLEARPDGTWSSLESAEPQLARAGLRLAAAGVLPLPTGARLREEHRVPLDADDWSALLAAYAVEQLSPSQEPPDAALLAEVRAVLPSLGRQLTRHGLRPVPSPVDRTCTASAEKSEAAGRVLEAELAALGGDLRALVVCDLEDEPPPSAREPSAPRVAGSARRTLLDLATGPLGPDLRPVLVTERRVAAAPDVAQDLRRWCAQRGVAGLRCVPLQGTVLYEVVTDRPGWTARTWTPLVTAYLDEGRSRVLVGTPGLLGEGWDAPAVSVVVDLSSAVTPTAAAQVRGRALRTDPERPGKVADLWTVVCVTDGHPGGNADHLLAARRHEHHLSPAADGEVRAGIGHCDPTLEPWAIPGRQQRPQLDARALAAPAAREAVRTAWRVGSPYRGELATLRVRTGKDLGLPGGAVPAPMLREDGLLGADGLLRVERGSAPSRAHPAPLWPAPVMTGALCGGVGAAAGSSVAVLAGTGAAVAVAGALGGVRYRQQTRALRRQPPDSTLEQLAAVVAAALHAVGDTSAGAGSVVVRPDAEGWLRCELDGVPYAQSLAFARALDELLGPLAEPRWLVARPVLARPAAPGARARLARSRALGLSVPAPVAWHAVPQALSRTQDRVDAFAEVWSKHVGPDRLVPAGSEEGAALLALLRGADPFEVTTQLRTVWR